jgi:methionyl-tRNA formyltransferase
MLNELLYGQISNIVTVVGVATDDPTQSYTSPTKRVWQYPHTKYEVQMVKELAKENEIDTYVGRIKTENFYQVFENLWRPEVCIMATYGQLVDSRLFSYPKYGFYNLHPCYDEAWPSYTGGNPFQKIIQDKREHVVMAMHRVNEYFDDGELVAFQTRCTFPK